ncbi:MAG TPA: hypothetical protein VNX65_02330 [Patescibacteria group bacterium]|jgi:hypothetical protein|nr:hypothetical protein [Patescibacteria group bacterium]
MDSPKAYYSSTPAYINHETWFELDKISKFYQDDGIIKIVKGVKIVNSYGRVREVWEDGKYIDLHDGEIDIKNA